MATAAAPATLTMRQTGSTRLVARFAWITLGYFIFVVLLGAVVRATGSGGGCGTHWPLCNGEFFPHHPRLATVIEYTHRSTSGVCTLLTAVLGFWTFRRTTRGHKARRAVVIAAVLLVVEALLGAALVLRHWVENNVSTGRVIAQSVHFTNTLLLMGALALTAWFLGERSLGGVRGSRGLAWGAVAATILTGATGSLAALADTLFPSSTLAEALAADFRAGAPLLVRMRWLHPAAAVLGVVCVVLLVRSGERDFVGRAVLWLLGLQFVLGVGDVLLLAPTWMQVLHLLGADLYWVGVVVLVGRVLWGRASQGVDGWRI